MKKLKKNGGFTLVEMLIVVAIIAILVAISIPIINSSLEKARDATDQANERSAKAEAAILLLEAGDYASVPGESAATLLTKLKGDGVFYNAKDGILKSASNGIEAYGRCTKQTGCYQSTSDHTTMIIKIQYTDTAGYIITWEAPASAGS